MIAATTCQIDVAESRIYPEPRAIIRDPETDTMMGSALSSNPRRYRSQQGN